MPAAGSERGRQSNALLHFTGDRFAAQSFERDNSRVVPR